MNTEQTARALDAAYSSHVGELFKARVADDSGDAGKKFEEDMRAAQKAHDESMMALSGQSYEAGSDDEYRNRLAKHAKNERERVDTLVAAGNTLDIIGQRYGVHRKPEEESNKKGAKKDGDQKEPDPPKEMTGHLNPSAERAPEGGPAPNLAFGPSATRNKGQTGPGYDGPTDGAGETQPKKR